MHWTLTQQGAALAQGWGVFDNSDHGMRIERNDEMQRFDCDAAAIAWVAIKALRGDKIARDAWEYLAYYHSV